MRSSIDSVLRDVTEVVLEQTTETFAAFDVTCEVCDFFIRFDQLIVDSLMIPFRMVVSDVFLKRSFERMLTEKDHLFQALRLQASHESFEICIHIRAFRKKQHWFDVGLIHQERTQWLKASVTVHDQV